MSESITSRVGRIISGGVNQLVTAAENLAPEAVMEQAVREVEGAIEDVRSELGRVIAQKHLANKRLMETNAKHEELNEHIDLAVKESRDDLAEAAIAQQLDLEAQVPVLETAIKEAAERTSELEGYVTALQAKKREMKASLEEFRQAKAESEAAAKISEGESGSAQQDSVGKRVEKAGNAFERVLEKQTGLASASSANLQRTQQLVELEDMARKNRIQERLAAAKSRKDS